MKQVGVSEDVSFYAHLIPMFERVAEVVENGDIVESVRQLTPSDILERCVAVVSVNDSSFSSEPVAPVDLLSKFDKIDILSMAIANVNPRIEDNSESSSIEIESSK